jgi:glycosyltransferase involved in cell wall biosynthesis
MHRGQPIVVFSHLRWHFVYQRPQHLLSRLATRHPVHVVEEPEHDETVGAPRWERTDPEPGLRIWRPRTRSTQPGFHPEQLPEVESLLSELIDTLDGRRPVAWLYTPLALPLVAGLDPALIVYDCMDELSLFQGAPPELLAREEELLRRADLVFTGGPSLYRAKRDRHPNVYCFPSSVDAGHFGRARARRPRGLRESEPPDQAAIPHPRLGYYGVLDERLDAGLLEAVADAHPEWQIVLVGPIVKIDPATLPQRPNIHYLGQRSYGELPAYLGGWDVCLLPFAMNDATRFISPTKTLEYMAAERPIVSTPITDVAEPYGDIVRIGRDPGTFVAACEEALAESEEEHTRRVSRMREVLARTSWDRTVDAMEHLMTEALARRGGDATERTDTSHATQAS